MTGQEAISIEAARGHIEAGQLWLKEAQLRGSVQQRSHFSAAMASAHFSASMAITNILLADPAEAPDVSF